MARDRKGSGGKKGALRFILTVLVLALFMAATVGFLYVYMDKVLKENVREGFSEKDVRPLADESRPYEMEAPPAHIAYGTPPYYSCKVSWPVNGTDGRLDGYPGIGAIVNLSLENQGPTALYVERAELITGWGRATKGEVGRYVGPGEKRYLRHLWLDIPDPPPSEADRNYRVSLTVLVNGTPSWTRVEKVDFASSELDILPLSGSAQGLNARKNWRAYYDSIVPKVRSDLAALRERLNGTTLDRGNCTVQDISDAQEWVISQIDYRSDPDGRDEWLSPMECLSRGEGDCEDFAILYGALITLMGGSARVIVTKDHAFNAVYIGKENDGLRSLWQRYGAIVPFQVLTDELGDWLLVEPQSFLVMGWFPLGIVPTDGPGIEGQRIMGYGDYSWSYISRDPVYVVDIYIQ